MKPASFELIILHFLDWSNALENRSDRRGNRVFLPWHCFFFVFISFQKKKNEIFLSKNACPFVNGFYFERETKKKKTKDRRSQR